MDCNQFNKSSKKHNDLNDSNLKYTNNSSVKINTISSQNGMSTKQPHKSAISLKTKPKLQHYRPSPILKLGILLQKPAIPLTYDEFTKFQMKQCLIGCGSYGNVYLSNNTNDQKEYAVKWLNKKRIKEKIDSFDPIKKEIEIHLKLFHPNIVQLYCYYEDNTSFYLIMDYCQQGNLFQLLKRKNLFEETEALNYFIQAALAVYFLHDNNLIHRDIKPENLLLDSGNLLKLCDFGLCNNNTIGNRNTVCGTLEYMAPEILSENSYDKSVDIWSLGVLLFELTNGQTPFKQNKSNQTHSINYINQTLSVPCKDLINKMLCHEPKRRINIKEIFDEPIIANMIVKTIKKITINGNYILNKPTAKLGFSTSLSLREQSNEALIPEVKTSNYNTSHTEPNNFYKKKNARSNSSLDESLFKFNQPSKIGQIAKDMMMVLNTNKEDNNTHKETTLRKKGRFLSLKDNFFKDDRIVNVYINNESESNNYSPKEKEVRNGTKAVEVKKEIMAQVNISHHLLDAINLVERAKIVKSQIEIPLNR